MLLLINDSREAVRVAINRMGVILPPDTPFRLYASKIMEIVGGIQQGVRGEPLNLRGPRYDIEPFSFKYISFSRRILINKAFAFKHVKFNNRIKITGQFESKHVKFKSRINPAEQLRLLSVSFSQRINLSSQLKLNQIKFIIKGV